MPATKSTSDTATITSSKWTSDHSFIGSFEHMHFIPSLKDKGQTDGKTSGRDTGSKSSGPTTDKMHPLVAWMSGAHHTAHDWQRPVSTGSSTATGMTSPAGSGAHSWMNHTAADMGSVTPSHHG